MTLTEITNRKAAVRAQLEELIVLSGTRAFSTDETARFNDLKAEAESLTALQDRYAILETLDRKPTTPTIPTITPRPTAPTKASLWAAVDSFLRNPSVPMAVDTPLQIQQSPIDSGLAASVPTEILGEAISLCGAIDLPSALGVRDFPRSSTSPLVIPFELDSAAVVTKAESASLTESGPGEYGSITLGGVCFDSLIKVSREALANVAFPLAQSVMRSIAIGQIAQQNAAFMSALKAACQANSDTFVDAQSGSDDLHSVLVKLIAGLDPLYGEGTFLLNPDDFASIADARPTSGDGHPLLDVSAGRILGKKYVLSSDADRCYYGAWGLGAYRSQTPLSMQTLLELYSASRQIGFKGSQWVDFAFAAETTAQKQPVVFCSLNDAGS
ncbi:MAG: phage major capsid protein [Acidobacteria bacterium]|nr:phage major capsid protein [Acidobacteriota bacterium]